MPATRRSAGSARGRGAVAKGQSNLLSFSSRVTKSGVRDAKKSVLSASVKKIDPRDLEQADEDTIVVAQPGHEHMDVEEEAAVEIPAEPEKSEVQVRADKVTDAHVKKYWKSIEGQWSSPRVHQEGLSLSEKILRYFDVSSQYGPCVGITRLKRWNRAERLGLNPPIEVLSVLQKEEYSKKIERAHIDEILNSNVVEP